MSQHSNRIRIPRAIALATWFAAAVIAVGCNDANQKPGAAPATARAGGNGAELTYQSLLAVLGNPDGFARARELAELLPKVGPEGIPVVKEVLDEVSKARIELNNADYELLIRYWALHQPGDAAAYAYGHAPRGYQAGAILTSVQEWMRTDPEGALVTTKVWAKEEGDWGAAVQIGMVRGWYDSGKPGLEQYIHDLGPSFERQRAITTYAVAVIRKHGVDDAVRWAEAVPQADAAYKLDVIRNVGDALVPFDIEAAQRFCAAHCDGSSGNKLRSRIATRWATLGDDRAALEWLSKAPQDDETKFAVRQAYAIWGGRERASAVAWMKEKIAGEPPAWLLPAVPLYVEWVGHDAPLEGIELAGRFAENPDQRDNWIGKIVRHWRQKDEKAAEAWIAKSSSLDAAALAKIRAPQTEYERLMIAQEERKKALAELEKH